MGHPDAQFLGIPLKYLSLALLTLQNTGAVLIMRYTRSIPSESQYLTSTAVISGEVFKVVVSSSLAMQNGDDLSRVFANPVELLKTGVPAFLYLVQNNLQYIAVSNLHAATYQVTYQLKILSTALMSVLLLGRTLSSTKWLALTILTGGVACVQLASMDSGSSKHANNINSTVGLVATLAACCCSGLAGVYFEKILKNGSDVGLWVRNVQLGLYSIAIGLVGLLFTPDLERVQEFGFFQGYTPVTCFNITVQAGGGLVIAVVIKYADNILKNFATAVSIILSALISWMFMGFELSAIFIVGVLMVNYAVYMYNRPDVTPSTLPVTRK